MRNYNQLTQTERYQIYALRKANKNPTEISRVLGRHKSTIYRELKRNLGKRGYRAVQAHQFAVERHMSRDRRRISLEDWQLIESLIRRDWSPEQISLWLKKYKKIRISHEWIYQYIFKDKSKAGDLHTHLRSRKKRKKRYGSQNRRGMILNRVSIEKRPAVVDQRSRIGDWEIDTIIGAHHQGVLLSLVERKSRLCLIARLANKSAQEVERTTINLLDSIKEKCTPSLLIMEKNLPSMNPLLKIWMPSFSLHIPMPHGKEDSMKTPMDSSDSTSRKKLNSTISRISKSSR